MSSTEDFILYSCLKVYEIGKEMEQELQRGLLLILLIKSFHEISKEIDQELHKGLLLIFLMKSV